MVLILGSIERLTSLEDRARDEPLLVLEQDDRARFRVQPFCTVEVPALLA